MIYEILADGRSGSTYLYDVLSYYFLHFKLSTDHLTNRLNEPFNQYEIKTWPAKDTLMILESEGDHVIKNILNDYSTLGLHDADVFERFVSLPKQRIILTRKNHFERQLSSDKAELVGKWHYFSGEECDNDNITVTINPERFVIGTCIAMTTYKQLLNTVKPGDILIDYEDLTLVPKIDFEKLGILPHTVPDMPDKFKRTNKAPEKQTTITNYKQLEEIYHTDKRIKEQMKFLGLA